MSVDLQLYSLFTPNGQKVAIALEEMGLEYDAHTVNITKGDQFEDAFIKINPNSKIPALVDLKGDNGKPLNIMESGAILVYLADKTQKFLPVGGAKRSQVLQWLFFQMGGLGPMFGQFGHFYKYAGEKCDHPYPKERYTTEAKRLLSVVDKQLSENEFIAGSDLSIADFSIEPWVRCLVDFYKAGDHLDLASYKNVTRWADQLWERPAFQKGSQVCSVDF